VIYHALLTLTLPARGSTGHQGVINHAPTGQPGRTQSRPYGPTRACSITPLRANQGVLNHAPTANQGVLNHALLTLTLPARSLASLLARGSTGQPGRDKSRPYGLTRA